MKITRYVCDLCQEKIDMIMDSGSVGIQWTEQPGLLTSSGSEKPPPVMSFSRELSEFERHLCGNCVRGFTAIQVEASQGAVVNRE